MSTSSTKPVTEARRRGRPSKEMIANSKANRKKLLESNNGSSNLDVINLDDPTVPSLIDDNIDYSYARANNMLGPSHSNNSTIDAVDLNLVPTVIHTENGVSADTFDDSSLSGWKREELNLLEARFKEYSPNVGSDKVYKTKVEMWNAVAKSLNEIFSSSRSASECRSKYYTLKVKSIEDHENVARSIKIKTEIEEIDSIHQVIMGDLENARNEKPDGSDQIHSNLDILAQILPKTLIELAKVNARTQERRHSEYMDFLKKFESKYMALLESHLES